MDWKAAGAAASARRRNGLKLEDAVDGLDAAGDVVSLAGDAGHATSAAGHAASAAGDAASVAGDALGAAGDVVGAAFSLEEGAIVLILPALAIALLILLGFGIFGFGAFMVADAPLLFAEVLLEGAVAGAVSAGAASGSAPASGWLFAYAKRVAPRALIVMALFFCADFAAAKIQPGAATWGEAFATFQSRREAAIEAKSQAKTQTQAQTPPADDSSADR